MLAAGIFASSYTSNLYLFVLFYGICFGIATGFVYMVPMNNSYKYFPKKKGVVSGYFIFKFLNFINLELLTQDLAWGVLFSVGLLIH